MSILMKCGHTAQGTNSKGEPVCVICVGITKDAEIVADEKPNLEGREAHCSYCRNKRPSDFNLPFFEHNPKGAHDFYYCGCYGWD